MACAAVSARLLGAATLSRSSKSLLAASSVHIQAKCGIVSRTLRSPDYERPKPFPYKEKRYTFWRALFDDVTTRIDENSKIIVVDGLPTGDKQQFAKGVAAELDMLYVPGPDLNDVYLNEYGYDMRQVNHLMPKNLRTWDIEEFLQWPGHPLTIGMQYRLMVLRFQQYMDALDHLFNTGQGVVMFRSFYSDIVFMKTLAEHGFVTKNSLKFYNEMVENGSYEFIRPHLVVYLDTPVDNVLQNIAARNRPGEKGSPFLTKDVLTTMERIYKQSYLRTIGTHSEVLVYDWSEGGDAEVVVEDICSLDFEKYKEYNEKMLSDWVFLGEWDWKAKRIWFSDHQDIQLGWLNVPRMYVPEIVLDAEENIQREKVLSTIPGGKYENGFNPAQGDSVLFRLNGPIKKRPLY